MKHPEDSHILFFTARYDRLDALIDIPPERIVELDLGCGKGGFAAQLGTRFPERIILAADIMIGRLRKLQKRNQRENIGNVIPLRVEARHILGHILADGSIHRLHILCPDPWPKDKHRANRLLCSDCMGQLYRVLTAEGQFHFSTDDDYYFQAVNSLAERSGLFQRRDELLDGIIDIKTDFEKRWHQLGKPVRHALWVKTV